jgi:transposase
VDRSIANRACPKQAIRDCEQHSWLRNQPQSALALWFKERVNRNCGRLKKTTIVALARKLLVALWKYVTAGVVIEGAIVKTA